MRKPFLLLILLMAGTSLVYSQELIVNGSVTGQDGNPVPSATVRSNTGNQSVQTDENGHFKISVASDAVLSISSAGYYAQEVPVKNRTNLLVTLVPNAKALNEVVVTALGIVRQEKALGYSTDPGESTRVDPGETHQCGQWPDRQGCRLGSQHGKQRHICPHAHHPSREPVSDRE